jgi:putative ABC transport system permease protein
MERWALDLRQAWRAVRSAPAFFAAAVVTLGLGIGITTAVFSVVNGVLLESLPYPDASKLVTLNTNESALNLNELLAASRSYVAGGGVVPQPLDWTDGPEPVQVATGLVTGGLLRTLGVPPHLGRWIDERDDVPGGARVAVVSHGFWQSRLGSARDVLGTAVRLSGESYTIVGVMPQGFEVPRTEAEILAPLHVVLPEAAAARGVHFLRTTFRLAPGVTEAQAQREVAAIGARVAPGDPEAETARQWQHLNLRDRVVGGARTVLLVLLGAVALVLLVACTNFANLLLMRGAARRHELGVRSSLGASRGRIVRQLVTESVVLAVAGGALGVLLSYWAVDLLVALEPAGLPRLDAIAVDARVLAFGFGVALLTGVGFGLVPALHVSQGVEADALRHGSGTVTRTGPQRTLAALVTVQVAMALVLFAGAGLLLNAFWRLNAVAPGFDPRGVLTFRLELPPARYATLDAQNRYREALLGELATLPGVKAALVSELPLTGDALAHNVIVEGRPEVPVGQEPELFSRSVAGDYFEVMKVPIRQGRALGAQDHATAPLVGVVNESFVREYFPDGVALGRRLRWARMEGAPEWITIVGVAADVKHFGLGEPEPPAVYTPYAQFGSDWKRWMSVVVRGPGAPAALVAAVKARVSAIDRELPLTRLEGMEQVVASSLAAERFYLVLLGVFAAVALALSVIGVFGVTAYAVERRVRELGLRMALGATGADVARLVVARGARAILLGVVVGLAGAIGLTRFLASMLYGVKPDDPATLAAVAVVLAAAAILACLVPALRAARLHPLEALRTE